MCVGSTGGAIYDKSEILSLVVAVFFWESAYMDILAKFVQKSLINNDTCV